MRRDFVNWAPLPVDPEQLRVAGEHQSADRGHDRIDDSQDKRQYDYCRKAS